MKTKNIRLGIQMFNFVMGGDWGAIASMEDVKSLLKKIRDAGFDGVEWCSFMLDGEYMDVQLLRETMDALGLETCGMHFHYQTAETLEEDCRRAVQRCRILGSPYLIFAYSIPQTFAIEPAKTEQADPHAQPVPVFDPEQIDEWIREADRVIAVMKEFCRDSGIKVLYHNHADELRKGSDGRRFLESITPDGLETDVYWVAKGLDGKAASALDYIWEHKEKVCLFHLKDGLDGSVFSGEMCGWGKGTYPLQKIIDCAAELGLTWVVSENDAPKNFGTSGIEDAAQTGCYAREHLRLSIE